MAKKEVAVYFDDVSGAELAVDDHRQIRFGLEGTDYLIDLSNAGAAEMLDLFGRYAEVATVVRKAPKPRQDRGSHLQRVREWAAAQGLHVAARGRVSAEVLAAYDAAH
jgi:hypothetical protein